MAEIVRPLTVVSFLWQGWRPLYDASKVNALGRMLQEHMSLPYRFVCVTDQPEGIDYATVPGWRDPVCPRLPSHHDSYRRLKLFSAWAAEAFPGWILMLDLDCLIVADLAPLITWDDFRILQNGVTPYNGSMWLHRTGTRTQAWTDFDPERSPFLCSARRTERGRQWKGSDQSWLSYCLPGAPLYTHEDGCYRWHRHAQQLARRNGDLPDNARIVFFPGTEHQKPWAPEFGQLFPRLHRRYMRYLQ